MWPFKRKKTGESLNEGIICPHCGSRATFPSVPYGSDLPVRVKTWRGRRSIERHCRDCGGDFYADIPASDGDAELPDEGEDIDDAELLELAEEDLKRRSDAEGDHRFPSY